MLTPDYLRNMCNKLRRMADDMEEDILAAIIAALAAGATVETITTEIVQITEFYQYNGLRELRRIITEATETNTAIDAQVMETGEVPREVVQEMPPQAQDVPEKAVEVPQAENIPPTQETPPTPPLDAYTRDAAEHVYRVTGGTWVNITETEAYAGSDAYVKAADEAALRVATGETSSQQAVKDAADKLAAQGLEIVTTEGGKPEHASTAIERNVRTSVARLSGDITLHNAKEHGFTLVLVSAHYGARPEHAVWQGQVYSIAGGTEYPDFYEATGYGTMLGLCGINCRHSFSPFAKGMRNPYEGKDYSDGQRYEDEQTQRAMERRIRALRRKKREVDALYKEYKTPELKAERAKVGARLLQAEADYTAFCRVHDFRPLWERTTV